MMEMNPRGFEILLGNLLASEYSRVAVTPLTADGGFDFVGEVAIRNVASEQEPIVGSTFLSDQYLYIFGQAKRRTLARPVEVAEIAALN